MITAPVIQSLWIGRKLSVMEQLCMSSFLQNGHSFHLYVYDEVNGIPDGVVVKDAGTIVNPDKIFKYRDHDTYAGFSNLFRYKLLLENGGYWADSDVVCLKPFPLEHDYVIASENDQAPPGWRIANCVIKAPAGSKILDYCYSESVKSNPRELLWGETGPALMTTAVEMFGLQHYVSKPWVFCPINWWHLVRLTGASFTVSLAERIRMTVRGVSAVHLWNEMWRRNGLDKDAVFPRNSIYERLKRRYLRSV